MEDRTVHTQPNVTHFRKKNSPGRVAGIATAYVFLGLIAFTCLFPFFWMCLSPKGGQKPQGELMTKIEERWGSFESFREQFCASAAGNFGSGWTWLVLTPAKELKIVNTSNAGTALASDDTPLLVVDVWEHAYYIDYRNARADYVKALFDHVIDWGFVAKNYYAAR